MGATNYNNGEQIAIKRIIPHPEYDATSVINDIALFELATPVNTIEPISLNRQNNLTTGQTSYVAGWGNMSTTGEEYPTDLMEVMLPIADFESCSQAYGGSLTSMQFCAGYMEGGKDSCQGDSGGPLITQENGAWVLSGVVSYGDACAAAGYPGVYTKISSYISWIEGYTTLNSSSSSASATPELASYLSQKSYDIIGGFGSYDFADASSTWDWAFVTLDGSVYQLQGNAPTSDNVFGWKAVDVQSEIAPIWVMFPLGEDIDGDGSLKFDWMLVGYGDYEGYVFKLKGEKDGAFEYSEAVNISYTIDEESYRVIFK